MILTPDLIDKDYCVCGHLISLHDDLGCVYECISEECIYGPFLKEEDDIPILS